jgi:hypothetical protein
LQDFFAIVGIILGVVALATNYWIMEKVPSLGITLETTNGTIFTTGNAM